MKRFILLAGIIISSLLAGCGKDNQPIPEVNAAQEISSEGTQPEGTEPGKMEQNSGQNGLQDSKPEPLRFTEIQPDCVMPIVGLGDFTVGLKVIRDLTSGCYQYSYYVVDQEVPHPYKAVSFCDLKLNQKEDAGRDRIPLDYFKDETYEKEYEAKKLNSYTQFYNLNALESIEGTVKLIDRDDREVFSEEFSLSLPEDVEMQYGFEPFLDAMAEDQILVSDEEKEIRLLGLGRFRGDQYTGNDKLTAILEVTNKSDREIPCTLNSCILNGRGFSEVLSEGVPSGKTTYFRFALQGDKIRDAGIDSIGSVQFLILTDASDSTSAQIRGHVDYRGGEVYEVPLKMKGTLQAAEPTGELIYEGSGVKVYLTESIYEDEYYTDQNAARFNLVVENQTENHISFNYSELKCNGMDCKKGGAVLWTMDATYASNGFDGAVIPAGCTMDKTLMFYGPNVRPGSCSCKLDFYSAGGGQLLFRSDEIKLKCER